MKYPMHLRITPHLWDYGMTEAETMFLAFLYERKRSHLMDVNGKKVLAYTADAIVEAGATEMNVARVYRYRKTLMRKRLLISGKNGLQLNDVEFKKWMSAVFVFPDDLEVTN